MERLLFLWDELDDLVGLAKHFGRNVSGDARASWRDARSTVRRAQWGWRNSRAWRRAAIVDPQRQGLKFRLIAPNLPRR